MKTIYRATWKKFAAVNVFAECKLEHENPETLLEALGNICDSMEIPTTRDLLYHLYVKKAAYAGTLNLLITVHHMEE